MIVLPFLVAPPAMSRAVFTSSALVSAGEGTAVPAAALAAVPVADQRGGAGHLWGGLGGPGHERVEAVAGRKTVVARSEARIARMPRAAPTTCVPGATRSGFRRPSSVGPRLEKLMMSSGSSASASLTPQPSEPPIARGLLGGPDGDHVLGRARRRDARVALVAQTLDLVAAVAGREDSTISSSRTSLSYSAESGL